MRHASRAGALLRDLTKASDDHFSSALDIPPGLLADLAEATAEAMPASPMTTQGQHEPVFDFVSGRRVVICGWLIEIVGAQQQPLIAAIVIAARPKAKRSSSFAGFQLLRNRLLQCVHDVYDVALFLVILRGFRSLGVRRLLGFLLICYQFATPSKPI
jgi:hypothetical protein